jgi:hypothetical protein
MQWGWCIPKIILKQKWFYLKTILKSLKIKEINPENPENHFNLGLTLKCFGIV